MSLAKREVPAVIAGKPETASTSDILEEPHFKEQVERGLRDVLEGQTISHTELKVRLRQWQRSAGH